ncbi:MAG: hypothetical protein QXG03_13650 [Halalkalicoccus sp.]
MPDEPFPRVASPRLDDGGWILEERTSERVFSLPTVSVEGHTLLYEQPDLRERVGALVADADLPWRFFFATRLTFSPPLAPGIGPMSVFPSVLAESRREFVADLRARGFESVERGRAQRMRTDSGDRARLTKYAARFRTDDLDAAVEAWFGVWVHDGEFRVAGGAYPVAGLPDTDLDPPTYREELLDLLRSVE